MVTRILPKKASSGPVLDYNEKKVEEGNAEIVASANLPDTSVATIYDTFEEIESNPSIATKTSHKSFHLALNPGPNDGITQEQATECIHEIMERLGYGDQPYVIYKHNDIEREHYHVVSTRINKKGKVIDDSHEGRRVLSIMKELQGKYNFTIGNDLSSIEESKLPVVNSKEFTPGQPNVMYSLKVLFEEALKYDFHSLYQFGCILRSMNVKATLRKRADGGYNFILQGLNDKGKKATRLCSLEKSLNYQAVAEYNRRLEENKAMGHLQLDRKVAIREISNYCLENTFSAQEYCSALEEAGIRHVVMRDPATNEIRRVTLVEKNTYALVDTAVRGELFLKAFQDAESSKRWSAPPKGRRAPVPGAKVRVPGSEPFFNIRRGGEVKERITKAINDFRGNKVGKKLPGGKKLSQGKK